MILGIKQKCLMIDEGGVTMFSYTNLLIGLGSLLAKSTSVACAMWFFDEPECPKSLLK